MSDDGGELLVDLELEKTYLLISTNANVDQARIISFQLDLISHSHSSIITGYVTNLSSDFYVTQDLATCFG